MMDPAEQITRVILARGADDSPETCERLLSRLPHADVEHQPDLPPARAELTPAEGESRRSAGKRTLVVGSIGRVLDRNSEPGMGERIVCFPYWHFNAVGNCPYDCKFCYLTGNRGNLKCPAMKVYTNLDDVLSAIRRVADRAEEPVLFYGSKLQDFVALDALTGYARQLVPFAASHPNVRLLFLTKAADIRGFLGVEHARHTILSWTLNAEAVIREYEVGTPSLEGRLRAARQAHDAGYEVRFVLMPMVPIDGWRRAYAEAVQRMLDAVRPSRVTLGGICMYRSALNAMRRPDAASGCLAPILDNLQPPAFPRDRYRYTPEVRRELYGHILECIGERDASIPVSLCLETPELWAEVGLDPRRARCNCLL